MTYHQAWNFYLQVFLNDEAMQASLKDFLLDEYGVIVSQWPSAWPFVAYMFSKKSDEGFAIAETRFISAMLILKTKASAFKK